MKTRKKIAGFTMVEAMIAMVIVAVLGTGIISTIIMAREMAEYDKQRMIAVSFARRYLEERTRRDLFPALSPIDSVTIDNFNTPDDLADDVNAEITMKIYYVNPDGSRGAELTSSPTTDDIVEVEITVEWDRSGKHSNKRVSESLSTYVTPNLSGS